MWALPPPAGRARPAPRANLVRYFGVFAPNARVRRRVVPVPPLPALPPRAASCPGAPEPVRPHGLATPSPGPSSSSGPSRPTSSSALAAGAPGASWQLSSFPRRPRRPRPSSSTCACPPGRFPLPRLPPRPSSASDECRATFETRHGLTTAPGLLYPPTGHHLPPSRSRSTPSGKAARSRLLGPGRRPPLHRRDGHEGAQRRLDEAAGEQHLARLQRDRGATAQDVVGHQPRG